MSLPFDGGIFDTQVFDVDQIIVVRPQFGGGPLGVGSARAFRAAGIDSGPARLRCEPGRVRVRGGSAQLSVGQSVKSSPTRGGAAGGSAALCVGYALRARGACVTVTGRSARLSRAMPEEEEAILQVLLAA